MKECVLQTPWATHIPKHVGLLAFIIPEKAYEQVDMLISKKQVLQILYLKCYVPYSRLFLKKKISNN